MTNKEKFISVFGVEPLSFNGENLICPPKQFQKCERGEKCCEECESWWYQEYKKINNENINIGSNKCGDCKYLDLSEKTTVGYVCNRPNHRWLTSTSHLKYKWSIACKAFEKRTE